MPRPDDGDSSLGHVPEGPWRFDERVARVLDDMMRRSVPGYDEMRRLSFELGCRFVRPGTNVVDLGCARGSGLAPFVEKFGSSVEYLGVDSSPALLTVARERFAALGSSAQSVRLEELDLARQYPRADASLTLAVLTLQFVPTERRLALLREAHARTLAGGALILVEKVCAQDAEQEALVRDRYRSFKKSQGYSAEEIDAKERSLEGVLVPCTIDDNERFLASAGWSAERFWQRECFAAWLARRA